MKKQINYRNLTILALVTLPAGIALGLYAIPIIGLGWTLAVGMPIGILSGLLLGFAGFRIRS